MENQLLIAKSKEHKKSKKIIVIDDEVAFRNGWIEILPNNQVETFGNPDEFAEKYTEPGALSDVQCIILDYRFENHNAEDKNIVAYIREDLKFGSKIALWTLDDYVSPDILKGCDLKLPKRIMPIEDLEKWLN